ncbi:hypothetical protein PORY_002149 [Pneumocystis oryctolagi]|uniref:Uncharacterized protein n=1 Tax=Pneumocystis oryctolagi TaxID=42067 RepID=A0ACB7CC79_9ASCO|nr:hypothetical protein PORY_002149 [Pneumocystis oryctolagi]
MVRKCTMENAYLVLDIEDVERHLPGLIRATNEWFRIYKIPDGKPENVFAFSGECKNKKYAHEIISECRDAWNRLITKKSLSNTINCTNVTLSYSPFYSNECLCIPHGENFQDPRRDSSIDKWFFISGGI